MSNKKLQSVLEDALEREIPSSQISLWRAIKASLVAGKHPLFQQGEKMNTTPLRSQRTVFAALTVALLLAFAFITPQGRALAQTILQFFTRTESDTFYVAPSDMTFEEMTAFHAECGTSIDARCSVEQVRTKVDFEIKELGTVPDGMYFSGATGSPDWIELKYRYTDRLAGALNIVIEATGRPSDIGTGIVAKSANVETVQIGDLTGEYYVGMLFQDEEGNVNWYSNEPIATLRWEDDGSTYTMSYYFPKYPLSKEELASLAASMTSEPVAK